MKQVVGKTYQLQMYGFDGAYKMVVPPTLIMSQISFSSQINGGQGQFMLKLKINIDDTDYKQSDIIKITCYDKDHVDGRVVYSGMLTRIKRSLTSEGEFTELTFVGLFSILNRLFFKNGANYAFTITDDPKDILTQAINYFNSVYTASLFDTSEIDTFGSDIAIDFNYKKCNDVLKAIQTITNNRFYYVGPDGKVYYKDTNGSLTNHRLKFEYHVASLEIDENIESSANIVFVQGNSIVYGPYSDSVSIAEYGKIETSQSGTDVANSDTAQIFGESFLEENKSIAKQTTMVVNSRYDIESIKPGDTVQLLNTNYLIPRMLITKVSYSYDKVTLTLNRYDTFASSVLEDN